LQRPVICRGKIIQEELAFHELNIQAKRTKRARYALGLYCLIREYSGVYYDEVSLGCAEAEMTLRKQGVFCELGGTVRCRRTAKAASYIGYHHRRSHRDLSSIGIGTHALTPRYDAFLFAPVCNDASGIPLSVVSLLARANVDPWEEASRLATMPKALAEKALAATLDLIPGRTWKQAEAKTMLRDWSGFSHCRAKVDRQKFRQAARNRKVIGGCGWPLASGSLFWHRACRRPQRTQALRRPNP
jgi:hypothetical protein